ncbi:MAG: MBL fold metallo-hydrolase [candidate division Zixibacteria bacterium]
MNLDKNNYARWNGKSLTVDILYSRAGIANQVWIENSEGAILIDCGDGILRDLLKNKINYKKLSAIFITHGHFDHMGGLHSLLGFLRMIGREETLVIYAPSDCIEVESMVREFTRIYDFTTEFPIILGNLNEGDKRSVAGMNIEVFEMTHYGSVAGAGITDPLPALGYRISCEDEIIAITGDTGTNKFNKNLVKGANLAIIESTFRDTKSIDKKMISKVHLTEKLAREYGKLAKEYILVHKAY